MKKLLLKGGKEIVTPWLNVEEAAVYCGISRRKFSLAVAGGEISAGRDKHFHVEELDKFLKGDGDGNRVE